MKAGLSSGATVEVLRSPNAQVFSYDGSHNLNVNSTSAAVPQGLCGKPVAFRLALLQSSSEATPRIRQGVALPKIKLAATGKAEAPPHDQAAEPLMSNTRYINKSDEGAKQSRTLPTRCSRYALISRASGSALGSSYILL